MDGALPPDAPLRVHPPRPEHPIEAHLGGRPRPLAEPKPRRRLRGLADVASRGSLYLTTIAISTVTSLASIPVVIAHVGPTPWSGLAVGQSAGTLLSVVVGFGWPLLGPSQVAALDDRGRSGFYWNSLLTRLLLVVPVAPALIAVVVFLVSRTGSGPAAMLSAASALVAALTGAWFYIGESAPLRLLLLDTVPTAFGTVVGALMMFLLPSAELFAAVQLGGYVAAAVLSNTDIVRRYGRGRFSWRATRAALAGGVVPFFTAATASVYVYLPLLIVSTLTPASTPVYALAERFQSFTQRAVQPVSQYAQGYVPATPDPIDRRRRIGRAVRGALLVGALVTVLLALLMRFAADLFSTGRILVPAAISIPLSLAVGFVTVTSVTGLACLTALGRMRDVARSTVVGAVVGLAACLALVPLLGGAGAAIAVCAAETLVLLLQLVALRRALAAV